MRGLLTTALTAGALFVLPGAAMAAGDLDVTLSDVVSGESGATVQYQATVENIDAAESDVAGTLSFSVDSGATVTAVALGTNNTDVTPTCDVTGCVVPIGVDAGDDFVVNVTVQLPKWYAYDAEFTAMSDADDMSWSNSDFDLFDFSKGGPSELTPTFGDSTPSAGLLNEWVAAGGTVTTSVTVKNTGNAAHFIVFQPNASGYADELFSTEPPAFSPTATVTGPDCAPLSGGRCELPSLAAGASVTLTITTTGLTHVGWLDLSLSVDSKADDGSDDMWMDGAGLDVTNGETHNVQMAFADVTSVAGNTPTSFLGELTNAGPNAITNGFLFIYAESFDGAGDSSCVGCPGQIQSIQSITLSNGATCANTLDVATPEKDSFKCPIASLPSGARLTFTVVASFPTAKLNKSAWVYATMATAGFFPTGSRSWADDDVTVNPEKYQDLEVGLASTAVIGADRLNPITVTIANKGNTKAEDVTLKGELLGVGGTFDTATLPATCTGVNKPQFATCRFAEIAPGTTASIVLNVRGGATLGDLVATFRASGGGLLDVNPDNNVLVQVLEVKKASDIPYVGVIVAKPKVQTLAQLLKSGTPTTVTCPSACSATVELQLNRGLAQRLGWVKAPRGTKRAKALPYIVIGKATKTTTAAGKVTVTVKLTRAYKLKAAKLTKPLVVSKVVTVKSTDAATKDASFKKAQNVTFKPAKKKKR